MQYTHQQNIRSKNVNQVYDEAYGCYVPKLKADKSIPRLKKIAGAVWTPVFTIVGKEDELIKRFEQQEIVSYRPIVKGKVNGNKSFFPGMVFAALTKELMATIDNLFIIKEVMQITTSKQEEIIFADMVMLTIAEQISRAYPFSYENAIPERFDLQSLVLPMTFADYGEAKIVCNNQLEKVQMYFNFKTLNKVIKFDLTTLQFRSLVLANFSELAG